MKTQLKGKLLYVCVVPTCMWFMHFATMKSSDHKLDALVPNVRSVPYALRLCNKLPIPKAKTKQFLNSVVFRVFSDRLVMDKYFNILFNLIIFFLVYFRTIFI